MAEGVHLFCGSESFRLAHQQPMRTLLVVDWCGGVSSGPRCRHSTAAALQRSCNEAVEHAKRTACWGLRGPGAPMISAVPPGSPRGK